MLITIPIEGRCPAGNNIGKRICPDHLILRGAQQRRCHIQQIPPVAIRHCNQCLARLSLQRQGMAGMGFNAQQQRLQRH